MSFSKGDFVAAADRQGEHSMEYAKESSDVGRILEAIAHLKLARDIFKHANCPKTVERVRLTLSSAKGALRNAEHRFGAVQRKETRKQIHRAPRMRVATSRR